MPNPAKDLCDLVLQHATGRSTSVAFGYLHDVAAPPRTLTFVELEAQTRCTAGYLPTLAKPGYRPLLSYSPGLDFGQAFLACLRSGIVAVPVPTLEPTSGPAAFTRLQSIARDAQTSMILGNEETVEAARSAGLQAGMTLNCIRT